MIWEGYYVYVIGMPNIMHITVLATGKFVLLQEYRLCAVCVKCKIVSRVHYEGIQNSGRKAPFTWRLVYSFTSQGKELLVPME
jgi:hypothetical protein